MHRKALILAVAVFLLAVFFRLWMLGSAPPGLYPDEAMNGSNALYALESGDFSVFYPENNGREGLFANILSIFIKVLGNEAWVIRSVSATFGSLTVLGMFFFGKELFRKTNESDPLILSGLHKNEIIALSASFFTAVSFWHINFSRIGFRAIMAPFFLVWGLYFLWLLFKDDLPEQKKYWFSAFGGFLFGLGAHSYIAYRVAPLLLLIPFWPLLQNKTGRKQIAIFLFLAFVAFAPLGLYYLENPQDFLGRTSQVSIFSEENPAKSLFINSLKTIGSFWFVGDWNPRHNFPGAPLLWWPVGILFALGLVFGGWKLKVRNRKHVSSYAFLFLWLILGMLPTVLSSEGLPHALRSIIMLPAVMFFAGIGFWKLFSRGKIWLAQKKAEFPEKTRQLKRIGFEFTVLVAALLAAHILITYNNYFSRWANMPETQDAFSARYAEIGKWLREQPKEIEKYILVNADGVFVPPGGNSAGKSVPMPSQTVMFLTDTWSENKRSSKNIFYILPENLDEFACQAKCVLLPLEPVSNPELRKKIKETVGEGAAFSTKPGFGVFYKNLNMQ